MWIHGEATQPSSFAEMLMAIFAFACLTLVQRYLQRAITEEQSDAKNPSRASPPCTTNERPDYASFTKDTHTGDDDVSFGSVNVPQGDFRVPSRRVDTDETGKSCKEEQREVGKKVAYCNLVIDEQENESEVELCLVEEEPCTIDQGLASNQASGDFLVPSRRVVQLFPDVGTDEASSLLLEAGVTNPGDPIPVSDLDAETSVAIQEVVDYLVQVYYPDPVQETTEECPLCLDDVAIESMVACEEGHIVCGDCIQRYAEEKIFGSASLGTVKETNEPATELLCFAEGCSSCFKQNHLQKALSYKTLERYGELQGSLNVAKANLEDLCTCPKCGFKAVLVHTEKVFHCPSEECGHESCRECGEDAHGNLTCAQMKEKEKERSVHKMEEAMTAALLRVCPNPVCCKPMIKDGGCNKLTCACGRLVCNVCKAQISGYDHFCQAFNCNHKSCGKCSLWNSTKKEDEHAINKAKRKGLEEVRILEKTVAAATANRKGENAQAAIAHRQPKRRKLPFKLFKLRRNKAAAI